jgi:heme-degrading monooxygenase HmoA
MSLKGDKKMAAMMVRHSIKDFGDWKKVFDSQHDLRESSGMLSEKIYRDASNSNQLSILFKWDSLDNAKNFSQSPELKAAMEKAGVIGRPDINFLNEV